MVATKEQLKKLKKIMPHIKKGTATDISYKAKMIDLHNEIYKTKYRNTTNCSSCLNSVWKALIKLYEKNNT
tara:strand:+ start:262 stop:474 length:213 start_codon:yes stop_codon:yes gene_type:complete